MSQSWLKALLSRGYFPKELPNAFTTFTFGDHAVEILAAWEAAKIFKRIPKKKKRGAFRYEIVYTEAELLSRPKRGYERRTLHITHPVPQALISEEIALGWRSVQKWLSQQRYSLDDIRISDGYARSIKGINFQAHQAKKAHLEATSDWLVQTDVTRFYGSIYTHSIPWAAYGKEKVKANLRGFEGTLADRLDILLRACNRNQTIGIPVGPETSRIIAEIISARVDSEVAKKLPKQKPVSAVDRLQDDWFVGASSLTEAETILSTLSAAYREYGLDINGFKTSISHFSKAQPSRWVSEINSYLSHNEGALRGKRLRELFVLGFRLQDEFPYDGVINFILAVVEPQQLGGTDVETLESFLLKAAALSPSSLDHICRIILNTKHATNRVSINRIRDRFTSLAESNLTKGNLFEVLWLLYTLRGLQTPLDSKLICELAEVTQSSALALLLLDMKAKKLNVRRLPVAEWQKLISPDGVMSGWTWLLGYEGIRHGWIKDPKNTMGHGFFKAMADHNVVFYDERRNVTSSDVIAKARRQARFANLQSAKKLMESIRGFEWEEWEGPEEY